MDRRDGRLVILLAPTKFPTRSADSQAPKPMGVMNKSELSRRFIFMSGVDSVFVFLAPKSNFRFIMIGMLFSLPSAVLHRVTGSYRR